MDAALREVQESWEALARDEDVLGVIYGYPLRANQTSRASSLPASARSREHCAARACTACRGGGRRRSTSAAESAA
jgi:hypothetical protein